LQNIPPLSLEETAGLSLPDSDRHTRRDGEHLIQSFAVSLSDMAALCDASPAVELRRRFAGVE